MLKIHTKVRKDATLMIQGQGKVEKVENMVRMLKDAVSNAS